MKKFFLTVALAAATFCFATNLDAQVLDAARFGIVGGLTSNAKKFKNVKSKSISLYHIGMTAEIPLTGGFALQPSLIYQMQGASLDKMGDTKLKESFEYKTGELKLPVQVQWGPDLIYFRPYVFAEPFIGYQLDADALKLNIDKLQAQYKDKKFTKEDLQNITSVLKKERNRLDLGFSLGAGLELGSFQLSAKYVWNVGNMYKDGKIDKQLTENVKSTLSDFFKAKKDNFNGITFSLAYFF